MFLYALVQADGGEGERMFDYLDGLELLFDTIAPGDSYEFDEAYGVPEDEVTMKVTPDFS